MIKLKEYIPDLKVLSDVEYYDIRLERRFITTVIYHNDEPREISEVVQNGGCVRVLFNGGWGFSSFTNLDNLTDKVSEAKFLASNVFNGRSKILSDDKKDVKITRLGDKNPADISLADKISLVKEAGNRLRANDNIDISNVGYSDVLRQVVLINKFGTLIERDEVLTRGFVKGISMKTGEPLSSSRQANCWRGFEVFEELMDKIPEVEEEIDYLLKAENAKGGCYDVIIDPLLSGVFAHESFGHTSEADFIYKDDRMKEILKLGRKLGSDAISIVDGPINSDIAGDIQYDDEGVKAEETVLLDKGVLVNHLHSRETAKMMGEKLTGNARALNFYYPPIVRMTNTYIKPSKAKLDELIKEVSDGLLIKGSQGGMGGEMFTFSAVLGIKIEDGKLTSPVKNLTLTGNLFTTLRNIKAVSDEVKMFSSWLGCGKNEQGPLPVGLGGPYVMIKDALIGGR